LLLLLLLRLVWLWWQPITSEIPVIYSGFTA